MNFNKYIDDWLNLKFDRNSRIFLLLLYAIVMFATIASEVSILVFVLLFTVMPVSIYFVIKQVFYKD